MMQSAPQQSASNKDDNLFDKVRQGYKTVADMAQHVKIRTDKIAEYADSLPSKAPDNVFDDQHHLSSADDESIAGYTLILDSVNFGSGYEPHMLAEGWNLIDNSIYYSLSTRLKKYCEEHGVVSPQDLCNFSAEDCIKIFELNENGHYCREFAGLCALSLRELGQAVAWQYGGTYMRFVEHASGKVENLVKALSKMHHFNDVHTYQGMSIPFYKRAQITAADLHLAFEHRGIKLFDDIESLTMFPDNGVPHVFRMDGILEYTPELAARIDAGEEIPSGSDEEIEIRACAGHVVELIAAHKNMISMTVDHILWHKGVEDARYDEKEPHRTLSQFY